MQGVDEADRVPGLQDEPLLAEVFAALESGADGALSLGHDGATRIERTLAGLTGTDLIKGLQDLVRLSYFLEQHKGAKAAANAILQVAATATPKLAVVLGVSPASAAETFRRFVDERGAHFEERRPPKDGEVTSGPFARFALRATDAKKPQDR